MIYNRIMMAAVLTAFATGAYAAPCVSGTTYATLMSGGCQTTALSYDLFALTSTSTPGLFAIPASGIVVNFPTPTSIQFVGGYVAPAGQQRDELFMFRTTALSGGIIGDVVDISTAAASGLASVVLSETICEGGTFTPGCSSGNTGTLLAYKTATAQKLTDSVSFLSVSSIMSMKDFTFDGGPAGGTFSLAAGSEVTNSVNLGSVPEPASLGLVALGLLAGLARLKQRAS